MIASVKTLNIGVINNYTIYLIRNRGGGYSVLVNYQSFLSNHFSLAPLQLFLSISCGRNRLLRVSFIELYDFIIYQHLSTRIKILPLATSQIARLYNQFDHVCTANFNAMFLKHYFFIKIALKLSYFCKKLRNFRTLGAPSPDPRAYGGWGLCPRTPQTAPPLRISGYAPAYRSTRRNF